MTEAQPREIQNRTYAKCPYLVLVGAIPPWLPRSKVSLRKSYQNYVTGDGRCPFSEWRDSLRDVKAKAKIRAKLNQVRLGNLGDHSSVGEGVCELRINYGPGYRIYFGQIGTAVVLLLCGGDKSSQERDISKAREFWQDYRSRDDA